MQLAEGQARGQQEVGGGVAVLCQPRKRQNGEKGWDLGAGFQDGLLGDGKWGEDISLSKSQVGQAGLWKVCLSQPGLSRDLATGKAGVEEGGGRFRTPCPHQLLTSPPSSLPDSRRGHGGAEVQVLSWSVLGGLPAA